MPVRPDPGITAIHDLEHLNGLSGAPDLPLLVSERTLYVLQNLVAADATLSARYATSTYFQSYQPVHEDEPEWALFQSVVAALQLEVLAVPDLLTILEQIRDNLAEGVLRKDAYASTVSEALQNLNANAGANYLYSATVPSGEKWLIDLMNMYTTNTVNPYIDLQINHGDVGFVVDVFNPATPNKWYVLRGPLILGTGDFLQAGFVCQAGDDIYFNYYGRKVFEVS